MLLGVAVLVDVTVKSIVAVLEAVGFGVPVAVKV